MAVPPSIPTSFVPKQPVEMHPRHTEGGSNMFLVVSLIIGGVALLTAIGVFAYAHILASQEAQKAAQLDAAQQSVSEDTVQSFLRLRDRLSSAQTVLDQHILMSQFFDALETLTLANVRFTTLAVTVNDDHSADVKLTGTAKDFNALAAQSASFATDSLIKQAIFSDITADPKGVVTFSVSAKLDPHLIELPSTVPASWTASSTAADTDAVDSADASTTTTTATTTP